MYEYSTFAAAVAHAKSYGLPYRYTIRTLANGNYTVDWDYSEPWGC